MEQSKIVLFLDYLILPTTKSLVNEGKVMLIDAEKELDQLIQNERSIIPLLPELKEKVKELGAIIDLSQRNNGFFSAKKRAESAISWQGFTITKEILAQQSSECTPEKETRHKREEKSRKAGAALVHDNPGITDLSDPNRPTKIAERFSELYDNEWTDAFDAEISSRQKDEKTIISELLDVLKSAYKYCTEGARKRIKIKSEEGVDYRNSFRKTEALTAIPDLQKGFIYSSKAKLMRHSPKEKVSAFARKCVELCWWMCIQERPVYMCNVDDEKQFNRDFYRAYTKSGSQLDYIVWPALTLYEDKDASGMYKDGPLLYRGVAQFT